MTRRQLVLLALVLLISLVGRVQPQDQAPTRQEESFASRRAELDAWSQKEYERILASQTRPLARTAQEVIQRSIEAMGGRQAMASLRTLTMTSKGYQVSGGFGATRYMKAPNSIRQERNGGRFIVTDGVSVWQVEDGKWQPAPEGRDVWQQVMSISLDLVDFEKKNVSYELLGTVPLEGSALYKLRKTLSSGKEIFVYFDVETGLLTMEEEYGDAGRKANLFFDYRDVAGVRLPHLSVRVADILRTAHVAHFSYRPNEPLEDALFRKP